MTMTRTALYRHFDASGSLLYVGISVSPLTRSAAHVWGPAWATDIAMINLEWHLTRQDAELAEWQAIKNENPRHNVKRSPVCPTKIIAISTASRKPVPAGWLSREGVMSAIEAHSQRTGQSPATITRRAVENSRLYARLFSGGDCTTEIAKRIAAFIEADHPGDRATDLGRGGGQGDVLPLRRLPHGFPRRPPARNATAVC